MAADDSFKKPGAIPFKWEIRPGVPKIQQGSQLLQLQYRNHHDPFCKEEDKQDEWQVQSNHRRSELHNPTPRMLRPPPAGRLYYQPIPEPRTRSFRSTRSERYRFYLSGITRSLGVTSGGCFPASSSLKALNEPEPEPDCCSDVETLPRWSDSRRRSLSSFNDSPVSSSFSSNESSSPRPLSDAEWAGFALF